MKIPREWMDEREIFDELVETLERDFQVFAYPEESTYGERGSIEIVRGDRRFALNLSEIK
jgi:hypothetical protein